MLTANKIQIEARAFGRGPLLLMPVHLLAGSAFAEESGDRGYEGT
jgi:hypothetical protein